MQQTVLAILFMLNSMLLFSQSITIEFDNIRNSNGVIYVTLYDSEETWLDEDVNDLEFIFPKYNVSDNRLIVSIDSLKSGHYGVAIMDDENSDGEMRSNFIGIPKEGIGFSNGVRVRFSKPKFKHCVFELKNDTTIKINIQYM